MTPLRTPLAILAAATAMAAAPAQDAPPTPLDACKPIAGLWKGVGKITPTGDPAQGMAFEATIESSWVAGDQALLEVVRATMANGDQLQFTHLYAYDRQSGRMQVSGIDPDGNMNTSAACHHVGDATLQTVWIGADPSGATYVELLDWTVAGDVLTVEARRTVDGGPVFVFATGSFARQKQEAGTVDAAQSRDAELAERLAPIAPMVGDYRVTGRFHGTGEMPAFAFSGTESNHAIAGGAAVLSELNFASEDGQLRYTAVALTGWDPSRGEFRRAEASNMDGGHVSAMGIADSGFYSMTTVDRNGAPYVETFQVTVTDGKLASGRIDGMSDGASKRVADLRFEAVED